MRRGDLKARCSDLSGLNELVFSHDDDENDEVEDDNEEVNDSCAPPCQQAADMPAGA
jgi:hypothetical protein